MTHNKLACENRDEVSGRTCLQAYRGQSAYWCDACQVRYARRIKEKKKS